MLRTLWGFVLAVFIFAGTASAQSPLHYAEDPWLILGEDTQLLQGPNGNDLSYRDFIISVLSVDILGKFLSELTSGQSRQAADVLAAGHVNVYLGLSAGEEYYDLLLDYNGDALIPSRTSTDFWVTQDLTRQDFLVTPRNGLSTGSQLSRAHGHDFATRGTTSRVLWMSIVMGLSIAWIAGRS